MAKWFCIFAREVAFGNCATNCSIVSGIAPPHASAVWIGPSEWPVKCMTGPDFAKKSARHKKTKRFDVIARECIKTLYLAFERGIRRETNRDYIRAMNNCLTPYFGKFMLTNITLEKVRLYEQWRNEKMGRVPISSTLANHASAFSRVLDFAIEQGWLSDKAAIPRLN